MNNTRPIYLDYASTTPVDKRVAAAMMECLTGEEAFGNPSSTHALGAAARARVERARAQVAALIGASADAIVWTGSATEANNLAILGVVRHTLRGRRNLRAEQNAAQAVNARTEQSVAHIVTARTEHKSTLNPCKQLEKEGCRVTYLKPDASGCISPEQVAKALKADTALVSIMHVNNELGTINDIAAIGRLCRERGIPFHVDAVQSAGKIPIDVQAQCIDLLSLSAHKIYGPKGVGALYVRPTPPLGIDPLILGGGQEGGLRSGTLATHQIVGMGLACEIADAEREADAERLRPLRQRLWEGLEPLGGVLPNPPTGHSVPHILNLSFEGINGESLLAHLDGLILSNGSTCNSVSQESSYVLRALGRSDALSEASLRFSLGRFTTSQDIDRAITIVSHAVKTLRELSPASGLPADAHEWKVGEAGSIDQGTWVRVFLRSTDGKIAAVRCQVYGCPHTLAACRWLSGNLPGRASNDPLPEGAAGVAQAIGAPVEKLGRLLLIEDALKAACAN